MSWKKINADELVAYHSKKDTHYVSKLLVGDELAGFPIININEGVLEPYQRTGGAAHEKAEIYYMVDVGDDCDVVLDDEHVPVRTGDIIIIPAGTFHWIDNTRCSRPFKLFTLWDRQEDNVMYFKRLQEWGKSMRYIRDEQQQEEGGKE
ncbi:MAG: cupin domain-containing protein [Clostridia bacterium]|nr:cupin domain-containing protein [Clostridia bacterium]